MEQNPLPLKTSLQKGYALLKRHFAMKNASESDASLFASFEKAFEVLKSKVNEPDFSLSELLETQPIQEEMHLSFPFMDSCYRYAKMLLAEKQYADAEAVFSLLCFLNPHVFDYWFAKGSCEHAQGSIDAAIESYTQSLFIEPTNPVPFFELADCFYQDSDLQSCMKTLEYCIELCAEDPQHEALMNEARSYLQDLRTKKAA